MKMRLAALAAAFLVTCAWGQNSKTVSPNDPCADKEDNASCSEPTSGKPGTCTWLTSVERATLKIRTKTDCRMQGRHAGSCHTCATPEQMSAISAKAKVNDPGAAKAQGGKPADK